MITYKLFRVRKDGSLGSLFINRRARLPVGKWIKAETYPTAGFKLRPGWHTMEHPEAPHLGRRHERKWFKVELKGKVEVITRPASQGGKWYLSTWMRISEELRT